MAKKKHTEEVRPSAWYRMTRGWQQHPFFDGDVYSRRDAWQWLIEKASYDHESVRVDNRTISLKRGQCRVFTRELAGEWLWPQSKVVRFLKSLKTDSMIDSISDSRYTIITICNYDKYQSSHFESDSNFDSNFDSVATQSRLIYKDKELKEVKELERGAPQKIGTRFRAPENGVIYSDYLAFAESMGWSAEKSQSVFTTFSDYWIAKSGKESVKLDWLATWRNWCRREVEMASNKPKGKVMDDHEAWRQSLFPTR